MLPAAAGLLLLGAAPSAPRALADVEPGWWEVSRSATGRDPRRLCLRDMAELAEAGVPGERCRRTIVTDRPDLLVLSLSCTRGDFARSQISVVTPRSVKLETQGIHHGAPFNFALYARRISDCRPDLAKR